MPDEDTASVYRERGRVWVRMELSEERYVKLLMALHDRNLGLYRWLTIAEIERADRSDIMERFDSPDVEMDREEGR